MCPAKRVHRERNRGKNMKKYTVNISTIAMKFFAIFLSLCVAIGTMAYFSPSFAEDYGLDPAGYTYENPHDIIIRGPGLTYTTTGDRVSIYGACDADYPIYMNGNEIQKTTHGFFAVYVPVVQGDNSFTFTNNGKSKTVVITKKAKSAGSGSSAGAKVSELSAKYLTVKNNNASRMSAPDADNKALMFPLAKGTVVQVTGETSDYYRLADGSFIYKSTGDLVDGTLPQAVVTEAKLMPVDEKRCSSLRLRISQNSLYDYYSNGEFGYPTVYNTRNEATMPAFEKTGAIKAVSVKNAADKCVYAIKFAKDVQTNGCAVSFENGYLVLSYKHSVPKQSGTLAGYVIHIDAGHGGSDTGALGGAGAAGPTEAQINLNIAKVAATVLRSKGATVIMTREDDSTVGLADRAFIVASEMPDFSLSIHSNSTAYEGDYTTRKGLETYYSFSKDAAVYFDGSITASLGFNAGGARYKNLAMTRATGFPAILAEVEYLSNPNSYEWLIDKNNQIAAGKAAANAVIGYFENYSVEKAAAERVRTASEIDNN